MLIVTHPGNLNDTAVHCTCGGDVRFAGMDGFGAHVKCEDCGDIGTWVEGEFWA